MKELICFILGTRPEIIKLSPLIRYCQEQRIDHIVIHTKQHYSEHMDAVFFKNLGLAKPKHTLDVGSGSHGYQTGTMMMKLEPILQREQPKIVLVQGDTNSVLGGALTVSKMHGMLLGHVEAGLRSFDRNMPEELNRVLADHVSDLLFAPTEGTKQHLLKEGIDKNKVYVTGNTVVDALLFAKELLIQQPHIAKITREKSMQELAQKGFYLLTMHRAENVDNKERLTIIVDALKELAEKNNTPIIYPIHPRSKKMLREFGLLKENENSIGRIMLIEPVDYFDFLWLMMKSKLILTDSGGVQEESCILQIPCVTLRENTERPETAQVGGNIIAGITKKGILDAAKTMLIKKREWNNPFGDGKSGERIVKLCIERLKKG